MTAKSKPPTTRKSKPLMMRRSKRPTMPTVDAPDDVTVDAPEDAPTPWDGGLVVCADDSWCQPVGCGWRKCVSGACVDQGNMKEVTNSFDLPAGTNLICGHPVQTAPASLRSVRTSPCSPTPAFSSTTSATRCPVRQENLSSGPAANSMYLVRSGQRLWTVSTGHGQRQRRGAQLDRPPRRRHQPDAFVPRGERRISAGRSTACTQGRTIRCSCRPPAAICLRSRGSAPASPTYLEAFPSTGTSETESVASFRAPHPVPRRQRRGSLSAPPSASRTTASTSASSNSGTVDITTLSTHSSSRGFFASSRKGAVALDHRHQRRHILEGRCARCGSPMPTRQRYSPPSSPSNRSPNVQATTPIGPPGLHRLRVPSATTVIAGGSSLAPSLDIVKRTGNLAPQLVKRIAMSGSDLTGVSVAGDNGYAYVVRRRQGPDLRAHLPALRN